MAQESRPSSSLSIQPTSPAMAMIFRASRIAIRVAPRLTVLRPFASPAATTVSKLAAQEAQHEKEQYEEPAIVKQFLKDAPWKFDEKAGEVNLSLTREVAEKTKVVVEWQLSSPTDMPEEDEEGGPSVPFTITVTKPSGPSAVFYCSTERGESHRYVIGNVSCYASDEEANNQAAYTGPEFEDLDDKLQESFDEYLAELGLEEKMCDFIDATASDKEQREYARWLANLQKFAL
mmetsp:Transcript_33821/g.73944  ORF Transcript_33821/g.73944 Transcript_33821/m.73944 type:complete len:233 (+) Transcript_33821:2-700(+)